MIYPAIIRAFIDVNDYNSQFVLSLNRGDSAKQLQIFLTVNGERYNPGEYISGTLTAVREDGEIIPLGICQYLQDGRITYDIDTQLTGNSGKYDCQLVIKDDSDGSQIACARFRVIVEDLTMDTSNVAQSSEFVSLQGVLDSSERLLNDLTSKRDSGYFNGNGIHVMDRAFEGDGGVFYLGELQGNGNVARGHSIIDLSGRVFRIDSFSGNSGAASYSGITLKGEVGATTWLATIEWSGTTTLSKESIVPIEGKEIAVGDFVIYTNCEMHRVEIITSNSVVVAKDGLHFKGNEGYTPQKGIDYFDGENGHTPQKGVDYWTEADKAEVEADISTEIASQLADRTQLTPEFANSIEECTDTTKLYVLPDGYIYGYIKTEIEEGGCTNLAVPDLENTTDTTKWLKGYRFSSSGPSASSDSTISNLISVSMGDIIRFKGATLRNGSDRMALYLTLANGNSNTVYTYYLNDIPLGDVTYLTYQGVDDDGVYSWKVADSGTHTVTGFRLGFPTPDDADVENIIFTVNEEIAEPTIVETLAWTSTGHAFVPADYEDRILALEGVATENTNSISKNAEDIAELDKRIVALEDETIAVPTHWIDAVAEAKTKIAEKQANGGIDCVNFVWTSDLHATTSIDEKGQRFGIVAKAIMDEVDIPLFIATGDLQSQGSPTNTTQIYTEIGLVRKWLSPIPYNQQALVMGNHDGAWGNTTAREDTYKNQLPLDIMYNLIYRKQAMDFRRVSGENGTYYYIDNVSQKTRFIFLNTNNTPPYEKNEDGTAAYDRFHASCLCQEQYDWFITVALDMPEGYTACIFGHEPYPGDYVQLVGIVDAYNNKGTFSNTFTDSDNTWRNSTVSVNFANAKGEIAGVFAGHTHLSEMRYTGNNPMYSTCPLITTTNSVGGVVRDGTTRKDGEDTEFAMDVVTLDKANHTIYVTRLGAGVDREVSYRRD